jgi:hypothetical protein
MDDGKLIALTGLLKSISYIIVKQIRKRLTCRHK